MASLFYIVGPSGSGKDSIMQHFRQHMLNGLAAEFSVLMAHRYITRQSDHTENAIALSTEEFQLRSKHGFFALEWHANNLSYGIGIEINAWLTAGISVIVNGSREYAPTAVSHFADHIHIIHINVSDAVLQHRLHNRDRECEEEIAQRMERHQRFKTLPVLEGTPMSVIVNESSIADAALELKNIVEAKR